jgi:hypothetical protein
MCDVWEEEFLWHEEEEEQEGKVPVDIGRRDISREPVDIQESTVPDAA